jgi:purine nucleoside phosphorylase
VKRRRVGTERIERDLHIYFCEPYTKIDLINVTSMMAQYGDVVGMTGGNEAELMCELRMPMAMLAMVDNFANGITGPLTFGQFKVRL